MVPGLAARKEMANLADVKLDTACHRVMDACVQSNYCIKYNLGTCTEHQDHAAGKRQVKHSCVGCHTHFSDTGAHDAKGSKECWEAASR